MAKRPPNIRRLTRRRRVDKLIDALSYSDMVTDQDGAVVDLGVEVRRDAVLSLGLFNDVRAIQAVMRAAFAEEDDRVLAATSQALISLLHRAEGDPEYLAEITSQGGDPDGEVGAERLGRTLLLTADESVIADNQDLLTRVLGAGSSSALSELIVHEMIEALGDRRSQVVARAQRMIVAHGRDHLEPIMDAVSDPERAAAAALTLGELHDNRALGVLADGLASEDPIVRRACSWAMGELADSRGVAELFTATTDPNYEVRKEAFAALDKLGSIGVIGGMATALFSQGALPSGGWSAGRQLGDGGARALNQPLSHDTDDGLAEAQSADVMAGAAFVENLAGTHGYAAVRNPPPPLPDAEQLTATSVDGTVLAIQSFGTGPAIVLAHGWGLDHRLWGHQIVQLSRDCRVITYDLRGHGASQPARGGDYSFGVLGEDLEAVLATALGSETPALIAGHSLGATSIASWARQRDVRGRAGAVGLLHLGVGNAVSERLLLRITPVGGHEAAGDSRVHDAVIRYVAFANPTDGQVRFYEEMLAGCPPEVRRQCLRAIADPAVHDGLRALALPTTVISGEQDKLAAPAEVSAIAGSLPDLRELVELPGTGHMSPLEQPEQVSLRLRELLAAAPDGQRS